jgi:hypothetical protein
LPGGRYAEFLDALAVARAQAGKAADTLVDSICQPNYEDTLNQVVNSVILTRCFQLGEVPQGEDRIHVTYNGEELAMVAHGAAERGVSWTAGSQEICLEGGLRKEINDQIEIFLYGDAQN